MSIFKNKEREYVIITNQELVCEVRKFAEEHSDDGCEIDIHVHGHLLDGDNLVTITFKSTEEESVVYSELTDEFYGKYVAEGNKSPFKIAIRRKLIFVFENGEEES